MIKKIISAMFAAVMILGISVSAANLGEACAEAADRFGVPETADVSVIRKCKNYRSISDDDAKIAARAMSAGLLYPKDNVLDMKSDDLTPLIDGLTAYGLKNGYKVVTAVYANGEIDKAAVDGDTFVIGELTSGETYTALIKQNRCAAVMTPGTLKKPVLYKARLYIADSGTLAFDGVMRYSLGMWMDAGLNGRLLLGTPEGFSFDPDFANNNLIDKTMYFYADAETSVVKIYSIMY